MFGNLLGLISGGGSGLSTLLGNTQATGGLSGIMNTVLGLLGAAKPPKRDTERVQEIHAKPPSFTTKLFLEKLTGDLKGDLSKALDQPEMFKSLAEPGILEAIFPEQGHDISKYRKVLNSIGELLGDPTTKTKLKEALAKADLQCLLAGDLTSIQEFIDIAMNAYNKIPESSEPLASES